tara:strand:- start:250 stop:567 length:318 start_codon:yes stop_codon:yes gene_type:complete
MFPKGGMQGLVKQAQEMQKKMKRVEDELIELRIKGSSAGKLVEIESNGKKEILSVKIDPSILEEDIEIIEDLILASIKQVYKNVDDKVGDKMNSITGGMKIPGML